MKQQGITIHMAASKFEVAVNDGVQTTVFDLNAMERKNQHKFRRELVKAWRDSRK